MRINFQSLLDFIRGKFPIIAIILLAAILRFVNFGQVPPSLNWDEASLGYNSYSILKTGKDEWGRQFPLTFEAFGDYKLPVYVYLAVPFIALFDLNELSIRLPSMLSGVLAVFITYLIVLELSKDRKWALVSAFLLAISPWHVFLSRVALEANLALGLFLLGMYFLVKGFRKPFLLGVASLFFGMTLFTYNSARVFVPIFLFALFVAYFKKVKELGRSFLLPLTIFLVFVFGAGFLAVTEDSASRYYWVAILDEGAINQLNQLRGDSSLGPFLTKLVYNRYTYFIFHFVTNYFSHFSTKFLFLEGGSNYQFSVPNMGLLYLVELPFLMYGVFKLAAKGKWAWILLGWVLLAPIPASITRESPHVLRSIFMIGAIQIITGYGLIKVFELFEKRKNIRISFATLIIGLLFLSAGFYFKNYFYDYPVAYSSSWQYGYKQAYEFIQTKPNLSERPLYVSKKYGEPHIFYLFYTKYDPAKYQKNPNLTRYERTNWRWIDRLDNIYFINDWEMKERLIDQHGYVITTPGNYTGIPPILKKIDFLDGKGAFEIVEI